jgi:hypothetical protein
MVKFLTDRVGHEKFGATSEVRRFIKGDYAPLYQCGYMLGGLQLIALHKELVDSGKMTEQQFHDAILKLGPIPVELIRASLLKQPLTPGFKTLWQFDDAGKWRTASGYRFRSAWNSSAWAAGSLGPPRSELPIRY